MPDKANEFSSLKGLTDKEVGQQRQIYGSNVFSSESTHRFIHIAWNIVREPMFLLLIIACSLYFLLGEVPEGIMMLVAMFFVSLISFYQEVKSNNAIKALQHLTKPKVTAIRNGRNVIVPAEELVPGDVILLEEGMNIPADCIIVKGNDLTVNESVITGESLPAAKDEGDENNILYQGTTINSGKCMALVTATGNNTVLGKLGKTITTYQLPQTLLQLQINRLVRKLALFGLSGFVIIFFVSYQDHHQVAASLLVSLTLAMSAVPEEIPVAFSSFMALGAYKMSKLGIISRQPQVIENLGAVNIICFDKTGTITENKMSLRSMYDYKNDSVIELDETLVKDDSVLWYGLLASEKDPFDAMEQAIYQACHLYTCKADHNLKMIHEYPLDGRPPMMTHVYANEQVNIVAAKGAAERIISVCHLPDPKRIKVLEHVECFAQKGYRVLGVASAMHVGTQFPERQDDFNWNFEGLLALYDPPKENVKSVISQFYNAGISVKMITGDHSGTAVNIAGQVGILNNIECITGEEVMKANKVELSKIVDRCNIYARMFPDAKLKVVEALKVNKNIVAMTGDGVNDGPALKAADIGVAMGLKGTEIARQAADIVLTDDDIGSIITAIKEGRKIFNNLKKAVRYIIAIHIPIILTASVPLLLAWNIPNIFSPIHIIFLELIMGPTCSVFFEREPVEKDIMQQLPRQKSSSLFPVHELVTSIIQGIVISAGVLGLYYYFMKADLPVVQVRTIVFNTFILANVFLTFVSRSVTESIFRTTRYKNNLVPVMLLLSTAFLASLHFIPIVRDLFQLGRITVSQFLSSFVVAFIVVNWFEIYKYAKRSKLLKHHNFRNPNNS